MACSEADSLKQNKGSNFRTICTSGSVVEYRLAKARVAGSNPVSCFFICMAVGYISIVIFITLFTKSCSYGTIAK